MKLIIATFLLCSSSLAMAQCNKPDAPSLPDGATSDLQTMVDGQKAVKEYVAGTEAYLACLTEQEAEAGGEADPELAMQRVDMHNAAVDEMEQIAAQFNEEIREYKEKSK